MAVHRLCACGCGTKLPPDGPRLVDGHTMPEPPPEPEAPTRKLVG